MGLLIENPKIIKSLLDEISMFCEIMFIDCDVKDQLIDNTVFYLNFGNEMRNTLSLNQDETNVFINNSNKILQILEENNEDPFKTFDYIRKFANFVINHKGSTFNPIISKKILSDKTTLYLIEPPCGSNTYIFESKDKFLFIDSGFNCFKEEMEEVFNSLFQDFNKKEKNIILTHCDMDHCGFLNLFDCVYVSESTYNNFKFESQGKDNIREKNILHKPYVKLTQIISNYHPPKLSKLKIIGKKKNKATISKIGEFNFEDLNFEIFEGNGGHINGEIILISKEKKLLFTGDIFVNIKGFSKEQKEFNLLAPYLMTNVDTDFNKAKTCRNEILAKYKDYLICPGHGKWVYNNF